MSLTLDIFVVLGFKLKKRSFFFFSPFFFAGNQTLDAIQELYH
jgi:hypothetical protein